MSDTRYVGFKEEAQYGVEEADTVYDFQVATAGLQNPDDPNIALPTLQRFDENHIPGFYSPSGDLEFPIDINTIGYFLKFALGGYKFTKGTETAPNIHEFWATQEYKLPSFTSRIGKDTFEHIVVGCIANTLALSVENELGMITVGVVAKRDRKDDLRSSEELNKPDPDLYPMAFYNTVCEIDGDDMGGLIKKFNWDFDNGVSAEDGQGLGSRFPYKLKPAKGSCTLGITVEDEGSAFLEKFWGNSNGPEDSELQNEDGVDYHIPFAVENIWDSGDFGNMSIKFPKCHYTKVPTEISGGDPRRPDLSIKAESTMVTLNDGTTMVKTPVYIKLMNYEPEMKAVTTP